MLTQIMNHKTLSNILGSLQHNSSRNSVHFCKAAAKNATKIRLHRGTICLFSLLDKLAAFIVPIKQLRWCGCSSTDIMSFSPILGGEAQWSVTAEVFRKSSRQEVREDKLQVKRSHQAEECVHAWQPDRTVVTWSLCYLVLMFQTSLNHRYFQCSSKQITHHSTQGRTKARNEL